MPLENIGVWSAPPDWADGLLEALEWQTSVLKSTLAYEQRFGTRLSPRQNFTVNFTAHDEQRMMLDLSSLAMGGSPFYLPVWHDGELLASSAAIGDTVLYLDATDTQFLDARTVMLWRDAFHYELAAVVQALPGGVFVETGLLNNWPKGTRCYPVVKAKFMASPTPQRRGNRAYTVSIQFQSLERTPSSALVPLPIYEDYYLLDMEPNDATDLQYTIDHVFFNLDNTTGLQTLYDVVNDPAQEFNFWAKGRAAHRRLRGLLYFLDGKRVPIWVPTYFADFQVVENISSGDASFEVKRCGFTDLGGPFVNRDHIQFNVMGGGRLYRKITGSALVGDGDTERIAVDTEFPDDIPAAMINRVSFLVLCRQDADLVELEHHTNTRGMTTAKTTFRAARNSVVPSIGERCLQQFRWFARTPAVTQASQLSMPIPCNIDKFNNYYFIESIASVPTVSITGLSGVLLKTYTRADFIAAINTWYGSTIVDSGALTETQTNMEISPIYAGQYVACRFWAAQSGRAFDNWFVLFEPHLDGTLTVLGAHWHRGTTDMPFIHGLWFYEPLSLEQPIFYGAFAGFGGVSFVMGALPSISQFLDGTYHAGYPGYGPLRIRAAGYYPIGNSTNLTIRWASYPATGTNQSRGFGFILPGDDGNLYYYHYLNREHLQNMSSSGANNPEVYNVIAPAYPDGCILRIGLGNHSYGSIASSTTRVNLDTHILPTADYIIDNADWQNADDSPAIPFPDEYTYISTDEAGGVDCYSMQIGGVQKRANGKYWVIFYMIGYSDYAHYSLGATTLRIKAFEFDPATLIAKLKYIGTCVVHNDLQIPVSTAARGNDQYLHITITESGPVATVNVYGPIYRSTFSLFEVGT